MNKVLKVFCENDIDFDLLKLLLNKLNIKHEEVKNVSSDNNDLSKDSDLTKKEPFTIELSESTINLVINTIKILQKNYFSTGKKRFVVPMILEDIAKIVGKDISTVSRILENRTYIIENETFYYNDLLNQHDFSTFDGRPVSRFEVLEEIRSLILNENKGKPLTDDDITSELIKLNYNIARRTVAKYRNEFLDIPNSNIRRIN